MLDRLERLPARDAETADSVCPRCGGQLWKGRQEFELTCIYCGYVSFLPISIGPTWRERRVSLLDYDGESKWLYGLRVQVVERVSESFRFGIIEMVGCPLCERAGIDNRMKRVGRGYSFDCQEGHRVKILRGDDGEWAGWV